MSDSFSMSGITYRFYWATKRAYRGGYPITLEEFTAAWRQFMVR